LASFALKANKTTYITQGVRLKANLIMLKKEGKLKMKRILCAIKGH
jgi:hypothetical protein